MSSLSPSALDTLLIKIVQKDAAIVNPVRANLNLIGPGFAAVDNPTNASTDVSLTGVPVVGTVPLDNSSTGTIALNPATQVAAGYLAINGSIANNVVLDFGTPARGQAWVIDAAAFTFSAHTITLRANGNNWATVLSAQGVWRVIYNGTKLYGSALTP